MTIDIFQTNKSGETYAVYVSTFQPNLSATQQNLFCDIYSNHKHRDSNMNFCREFFFKKKAKKIKGIKVVKSKRFRRFVIISNRAFPYH